jgi:hypothetical protein
MALAIPLLFCHDINQELEVSLCLSEGRLCLLQHKNGGSVPVRLSFGRHIGAGFIGTSNDVRRRREKES